MNIIHIYLVYFTSYIETPDHQNFLLRKEMMYPKKDCFSFISIETTHNIDVILRKNNTAADDVANLPIFHFILDG